MKLAVLAAVVILAAVYLLTGTPGRGPLRTVGGEPGLPDAQDQAGPKFPESASRGMHLPATLSELAPGRASAGFDDSGLTPLQQEGNDAEAAKGQSVVSKLESLLDMSLGELPPDLSQLEEVVQDLAHVAVINPESIVLNRNGDPISAELSIPGTQLSGKIDLYEQSSRIAFAMGGGDGYVGRELTLAIPRDGSHLVGGTMVLQHHPDTRLPCDSVLGPEELMPCGWSYAVDGEHTVVKPIMATIAPNGRGWILGMSPKERLTTLEGSVNLSPFDTWAKTVSQSLSSK